MWFEGPSVAWWRLKLWHMPGAQARVVLPPADSASFRASDESYKSFRTASNDTDSMKRGDKDLAAIWREQAVTMRHMAEGTVGAAGESVEVKLGVALGKITKSVPDLLAEWDANGDHQLSRAEFRIAVRKNLSVHASNKEVDGLFDTLDVDKVSSLLLFCDPSLCFLTRLPSTRTQGWDARCEGANPRARDLQEALPQAR